MKGLYFEETHTYTTCLNIVKKWEEINKTGALSGQLIVVSNNKMLHNDNFLVFICDPEQQNQSILLECFGLIHKSLSYGGHVLLGRSVFVWMSNSVSQESLTKLTLRKYLNNDDNNNTNDAR